ncbi:DUF4253 domain-containing protein [Streptomyces sp. PLK6-54]|uniref:DUF4253 domain-containing protein n=1 Tax=Actinacidiphila acidipaludis TaxID=2873382 RepID=A0ABS7PZY5_9ACTN|nr:DUF4253 domain-containing protein [Streptomyces acidipaludis]
MGCRRRGRCACRRSTTTPGTSAGAPLGAVAVISLVGRAGAVGSHRCGGRRAFAFARCVLPGERCRRWAVASGSPTGESGGGVRGRTHRGTDPEGELGAVRPGDARGCRPGVPGPGQGRRTLRRTGRVRGSRRALRYPVARSRRRVVRAPADAGHVAARVLATLLEDDGAVEDLGLLDRPHLSKDLAGLAEESGLDGGRWPYDLADVVTVLRSWEERFGTRLVGRGDDRMVVSVAAPVTTSSEAEAIAAEHFAFASDTITQGDDESLRAYAAHQILGAQVWSFWGD